MICPAARTLYLKRCLRRDRTQTSLSLPIFVLSLELGKSVWRHVYAAKVLVMHDILEGASGNRRSACAGRPELARCPASIWHIRCGCAVAGGFRSGRRLRQWSPKPASTVDGALAAADAS